MSFKVVLWGGVSSGSHFFGEAIGAILLEGIIESIKVQLL